MSKVLDGIDDDLSKWLESQHVFFVATAPLSEDGHVNCSPKGGNCFRVLGSRTVAYLDFTGSGAETAAHIQENGRIVIMFCAFEGTPNIVRLHGKGSVLLAGQQEYFDLIKRFPVNAGARAIILVDVSRVSSSCGFSAPLMDFVADRAILDRWAESNGPEGLKEYRQAKNSRSIDDLPALAR